MKFSLVSPLVLIATSALLSACSKFDSATPPAAASTAEAVAEPTVVAADVVDPGHVATECPTFPERYRTKSDGALMYTNRRELNGVVSYSLFDSEIIADGKVHRSPKRSDVGATYVANCRKGVLTVTLSTPTAPAVNPSSDLDTSSKSIEKKPAELTMTVKSVATFTKHNEENDFVVRIVEGDKVEFEIMISADPSIRLPTHAAAECPVIDGTYAEQSQKMNFVTVKTEAGAIFKLDSQTIIADGTQQNTDLSGDRDTYIAICSKNQLKVFLFQDGDLSASLSFALRGSADQIFATETRGSGRTAKLRLSRVMVPPATEPAPVIAPPMAPISTFDPPSPFSEIEQ